MLQQTTVGAVLPRFARFLERFPDVAALSRAREESVVAEWSGLGYYSRARNLHRAARQVVREHRGQVPRELDQLRALPRVGEYMAAAVASLAFGVRAPAADANVTRIISRLHAIPGPVSTRAHRERVRAAAADLLPARNPGDVTAALMDLGQSICLPRRPRCVLCPVLSQCAGAREGAPEKYPEKTPLAPIARVFLAAAYVPSGNRVLLVRRGPGSWLAGTWAFPAAEGSSAQEARRALARALRRTGLRLGRHAALGRATHTIVRRRLEIEVLPAGSNRAPLGARAGGARRGRESEPAGESRWFTARELDRAAVSTLTRKIARAAGFLPEAD